jgi:hypothetical protein
MTCIGASLRNCCMPQRFSLDRRPRNSLGRPPPPPILPWHSLWRFSLYRCHTDSFYVGRSSKDSLERQTLYRDLSRVLSGQTSRGRCPWGSLYREASRIIFTGLYSTVRKKQEPFPLLLIQRYESPPVLELPRGPHWPALQYCGLPVQEFWNILEWLKFMDLAVNQAEVVFTTCFSINVLLSQ